MSVVRIELAAAEKILKLLDEEYVSDPNEAVELFRQRIIEARSRVEPLARCPHGWIPSVCLACNP